MIEHEDEPIRGLPGHLPEGEHIVWQGAPEWRALARGALRTRWVAAYFVVLLLWTAASGVGAGQPLGALALKTAMLALAAGVCLGLLYGFAWLSARTTVYTITNRRIVLRYGVALSKCFNLPFTVVASAGLKTDADGVGDIPVALTDGNKIAYPLLWPHARPLRFSRPEPMLRAIPDAAAVAGKLGAALAQASREANRPYAVEAPKAEADGSRPSLVPARQPVSA
jgi:hypothetical protein